MIICSFGVGDSRNIAGLPSVTLDEGLCVWWWWWWWGGGACPVFYIFFLWHNSQTGAHAASWLRFLNHTQLDTPTL